MTRSTSVFSNSAIICKYVFCVVVILACTNLRATLIIDTPANNSYILIVSSAKNNILFFWIMPYTNVSHKSVNTMLFMIVFLSFSSVVRASPIFLSLLVVIFLPPTMFPIFDQLLILLNPNRHHEIPLLEVLFLNH